MNLVVMDKNKSPHGSPAKNGRCAMRFYKKTLSELSINADALSRCVRIRLVHHPAGFRISQLRGRI